MSHRQRADLQPPCHLLQGGREFFPALIAAIDAAQRSVQMETYIFDAHGAGAEVAQALMRAARRGLSVQLLIDGLGADGLDPSWRQRLQQAGVQLQLFAPLGRVWASVRLLLAPAQWRRLHRKLCVVDGVLAFCGGINILDDMHDPRHGVLPAPRLDFCVQLRGPLVADIYQAMHQLWLRQPGVHGFQRQALAEAWLPQPADRRPAPGPEPQRRSLRPP